MQFQHVLVVAAAAWTPAPLLWLLQLGLHMLMDISPATVAAAQKAAQWLSNNTRA
jgi:hypothetical protein